ncbi:MAG: hypothetical protein M1831_007083 [Alyxoria varia]|nr:MAG: hypothetical protein M1831_007083 [Alyxoria varia]
MLIALASALSMGLTSANAVPAASVEQSIEERAVTRGAPRTSKYDNQKAGLLGLPVRPFQSLGTYEGLNYAGIELINVGTALAGVKAQSAPNVIAFDVLGTSLGGAGIKKAQISSIYDGSRTDRFDAKSLYFGCVLANAATVLSTPLSCTLTARGLDGQGKERARAKFDFKPSVGTLVANMKKATFGKEFVGIKTLELSVNGGIASLAVATLLDNLETVQYHKV